MGNLAKAISLTKKHKDPKGGLTEAGRRAYNRATGSNLKPPAPNPKTEADKGRKASFCARMGGVVAKSKNAERAKASLRRWNCP